MNNSMIEAKTSERGLILRLLYEMTERLERANPNDIHLANYAEGLKHLRVAADFLNPGASPPEL